MVEHILGLSGEPDLIDELGRHQVINDRFDAQHGQQVEVEAEPTTAAALNVRFAFGRKPSKTRGDGRLQAWQAHSPQQPLPSTGVRPRSPPQHSPLG